MNRMFVPSWIRPKTEAAQTIGSASTPVTMSTARGEGENDNESFYYGKWTPVRFEAAKCVSDDIAALGCFPDRAFLQPG